MWSSALEYEHSVLRHPFVVSQLIDSWIVRRKSVKKARGAGHWIEHYRSVRIRLDSERVRDPMKSPNQLAVYLFRDNASTREAVGPRSGPLAVRSPAAGVARSASVFQRLEGSDLFGVV